MSIKTAVVNTDGRQFMLIYQAEFSLVCSWHWNHQLYKGEFSFIHLFTFSGSLQGYTTPWM